MPNKIIMKQAYFDKLNLTRFIKVNEDDNSFLRAYQGLQVVIDDTIEEDYIIE